MVTRRSYSREFKMGLCNEIISGVKSKSQVCRENGFSPSMLDRWVDQFKVLGSQAFPNSEEGALPRNFNREKELEAMLGRVTMELEFAKAVIKKGRELREKKPS